LTLRIAAKSIEVSVRPRRGSAATCSRCHQTTPGYDELAERRFEFIPLWGFLVFLLYTMRRVDCHRCGAVVVEEVPWGDGKRSLTKAYMLFLARWARRLSWKETAEAFRTSCDKVFDAVEHVVTWGLAHRTLGQIDAIGVDEMQYAKGHKYLTLVYQIDPGITRLPWVGKERTNNPADSSGLQPGLHPVMGPRPNHQRTSRAAPHHLN
jgi:transposase